MKPQNCQPLIAKLSAQIGSHILQSNVAKTEFCIIGIQTGGAWIAQEVLAHLKRDFDIDPDSGSLNIGFYRDDFTQIGLHPHVAPSNIDFDIENRVVILIDDVFYTGRTVRAALNEIFDYGRPSAVLLGVLIERNGKQLPIRPDFCAKQVVLNPNQYLAVSGPLPITYEIKS